MSLYVITHQNAASLKNASKKLELDLKTFHTPNSQKTKRIFEDFTGVDVTEGWEINGIKPEEIRGKLNKWIKKRGDAVHRSVTDKKIVIWLAAMI